MAQPVIRASLLRAALRPKSNLLDLTPAPPKPRTAPPRERPQEQAQAQDAHIEAHLLKSPLRRCILTNRVLPSDMMIQLKLAQYTPASGAARPKLVFTPNRVLHPKFSINLPGKGAWVSCWKAGLDSLAQRGSYKRLSPTASFPPSTTSKIHSQLARRVTQEATLLAERAKSRPVATSAGCPVVRVAREDWEEVGRVEHLGMMERDGWDVAAVVQMDGKGEEGGRFSRFLPAHGDATTERRVPIYHLPTFLATVTLPPSSPPSFSSPPLSTSPPPSAAESLSLAIATPLDSLVDLFARRESEKVTSPTTSSKEEDPCGVYVFYVERREGGGGEGHGDVVPLLVALWRCRLWMGEGWEGVELEKGGGGRR